MGLFICNFVEVMTHKAIIQLQRGDVLGIFTLAKVTSWETEETIALLQIHVNREFNPYVNNQSLLSDS